MGAVIGVDGGGDVASAAQVEGHSGVSLG